MRPSSDGKLKYMLICKDDITSFSWLLSSSDPDAETAMMALASWIPSFRSMTWLVSVQGSHLTSRLTAQLVDEARMKEHFTMAIVPELMALYTV